MASLLERLKTPEHEVRLMPPTHGHEVSHGSVPVFRLDAHHAMLKEGHLEADHLRRFEGALQEYQKHVNAFFDDLDDFFLSTGNPSAFAYTEGMTHQFVSATGAPVHPHGLKTPPAPGPSSTSATSPEPVLDIAAAAEANLRSLPAAEKLREHVPHHQLPESGTAVPIPIDLPEEHASLFSLRGQRAAVAEARQAADAALRGRLGAPIELWMQAYDEAKAEMPRVEHLMKRMQAARAKVEEAKSKVQESEAQAPLVQLRPGESHPTRPDVGGGLVPERDTEARNAWMDADAVFTDTQLEFEDAQARLHSLLSWMCRHGGRLKGHVTLLLEHLLADVAARELPLKLIVPFPGRVVSDSGPAAAHASVVDIIKREHRQLWAVKSQWEACKHVKHAEGIGYGGEAQLLAWQLTKLLSQHSAKEEEVVYPVVRERMGAEAAEHLLNGHRALKALLAQLEARNAADGDEFAEAMDAVFVELDEHIRVEEQEELPKLQDIATPNELSQLGRQYDAAAHHAPTRPHPSAPDSGGVLTTAAHMGAAVVDRAADLVRFGGTERLQESGEKVPLACAPVGPHDLTAAE